MPYRAILNVDLQACPPNDRQRFMKAMEELDWYYTGTSAMALDGGDLDDLRSALVLLARALPGLGNLTAVTIQAQRMEQGAYPGTMSPANALQAITQMPLPPR